MKPAEPREDLGNITLFGRIIEDGTIEGSWESTVDTQGTFLIYPLRKNLSPTKGNVKQSNKAFIMMAINPNDTTSDDVLDCLKRTFLHYGIEAIRSDEVEHSGRITDLILNMINENKFLVCDLSYERPNVYYELGYAHGISKNVILIAKEGTILHFDVKDYNAIYYKNIRELENKLKKRLEVYMNPKL